MNVSAIKQHYREKLHTTYWCKRVQIATTTSATQFAGENNCTQNLQNIGAAPMMRLAIFIASATMSALSFPAVASECTSTSEIAASRIRWATVRNQPLKPADNEQICRAFASSFYESVTTRQVAASCIRTNDRQRDLALLDSAIEALNNMLASKCGG